jgi:hypothetical protein
MILFTVFKLFGIDIPAAAFFSCRRGGRAAVDNGARGC